MKKTTKENMFIVYIPIFIVVFLIGAGTMMNIKNEQIEDMTLIKNGSNEWYWLENQEYTQRTLNECYTLKNILISNECVDGGFIENSDGGSFMIVCYEAKKIMK